MKDLPGIFLKIQACVHGNRAQVTGPGGGGGGGGGVVPQPTSKSGSMELPGGANYRV